ncbi:MAG: hypothetical protein NZ993_03700 [Bacteroidetes bacterium]|nr:hypothetical protein [Bacteroidota bacterium]
MRLALLAAICSGQVAWLLYGPQVAEQVARARLAAWFRAQALQVDAAFEQALEKALERTRDPEALPGAFEEAYRSLRPKDHPARYFRQDFWDLPPEASLEELLRARAHRFGAPQPPMALLLGFMASFSGSASAQGAVAADPVFKASADPIRMLPAIAHPLPLLRWFLGSLCPRAP